MKESVKIKLLVTGLLIVLMTACAIAQPNYDTDKVKLDLTVKINNQNVKDTSYILTIYNFNTESFIRTHVPNNFVLYLDFDTKFEISVSYKGTNIKVINVDTEAPMDNWYINADVNLNTNDNKRILAGGIKYDTLLRTFKKYK